MIDQHVNKSIRERGQILADRQNLITSQDLVNDIEKAKRGVEGEVRTHSDGKKYQKRGDKWVPMIEKKTPPTGTKKERPEKKSKEQAAKKSSGKTIPAHVSRHHVGALRHIKELVGGSNFAEAHGLAEKLPDNVKHEIPASVWKDMVAHSHKENMANEKQAADDKKSAFAQKKEVVAVPQKKEKKK